MVLIGYLEGLRKTWWDSGAIKKYNYLHIWIKARRHSLPELKASGTSVVVRGRRIPTGLKTGVLCPRAFPLGQTIVYLQL